jgi:hypothetical protein
VSIILNPKKDAEKHILSLNSTCYGGLFKVKSRPSNRQGVENQMTVRHRYHTAKDTPGGDP